MWMHRAALATATTLSLATAALAAEPPPPLEAKASLHWTQPLAPQSAVPAAGLQAASDDALQGESGRGTQNTSVALTEQTLSAINTGNTIKADAVSSGAISLQDNALSGFAGVGNILMNTGHNNNLESNMSVTVIVTP